MSCRLVFQSRLFSFGLIIPLFISFFYQFLGQFGLFRKKYQKNHDYFMFMPYLCIDILNYQ